MRPRKPSITIPNHVEVDNPHTLTLSNGVRAHLLENHEYRVIRLSLIFGAGSSRQEVPFSATTTANLLSEGSRSHTARQIAERLDFYGSYFDISTDRDVTVISFCALSKFFLPTLKVAEEILLQPAFPTDEFDSYRIKRRQQLAVERTKVDVRAREAFARAMFGEKHPYGISSPESAYDTLSRDDVERFYRRFYTAGNCFAVCSGDIGPNELDAITELCNHLPMTGDTTAPVFPAPQQTPCIHLPHDGAVQSAIRIGRLLFPRNHPDYVGMQVVASILGGYFGSRLMNTLREENGLTYGVFAGMVTLEQAGYMAIVTQVAREARDEALRQIYTEIERLRNEPVGEQELTLVKNMMVGEIMRILDGPFGIVDVTIENIQCGFDNSAIGHTVNAIRECTPDDILRLSDKYLRAGDLVEVTVG